MQGLPLQGLLSKIPRKTRIVEWKIEPSQSKEGQCQLQRMLGTESGRLVVGVAGIMSLCVCGHQHDLPFGESYQ